MIKALRYNAIFRALKFIWDLLIGYGIIYFLLVWGFVELMSAGLQAMIYAICF